MIEEIVKSITKTYGSLLEPDYRCASTPDRQLIPKFLMVIAEHCFVHDVTDANEDVCTAFRIWHSSSFYLLQISNIGRYAFFMKDQTDHVYSSANLPSESNIRGLYDALTDMGLVFLSKEVLSNRIEMKLFYADDARLYNALFADVECLPWEPWFVHQKWP